MKVREPGRGQCSQTARTCPSVHLIGRDSCLPHARLHVLENLLGTAGWSPAATIWPLRLSLTRPHDDFNFEELLSDLTTIARTIHPHLGLRLVGARLTFGGRRTNPVKKSTCTSTTPQLSEHAGLVACLSTLYTVRWIDPSAKYGCCERGCYAA